MKATKTVLVAIACLAFSRQAVAGALLFPSSYEEPLSAGLIKPNLYAFSHRKDDGGYSFALKTSSINQAHLNLDIGPRFSVFVNGMLNEIRKENSERLFILDFNIDENTYAIGAHNRPIAEQLQDLKLLINQRSSEGNIPVIEE
ncbi:MAG TPA: hypothetical protein PLQ76_09415 [bacterium]|nr:hypothetical protein [bacterium]